MYWARLYTSQLLRGDTYADLAPAVSIFLLNFEELPSPRYHSIFRLLDIHEYAPLSEDLTLHFLELPKLPTPHPDLAEPAVLRWSRVFAARSEQELENLAVADPNLRQAKDALERLSDDPKAQELARERELWAYFHDYGLRLARRNAEEKGRAEGREPGHALGRAEGRAAGLAEGRAEALLNVLEKRGMVLAPAARERILTCRNVEQLDAWLDRSLVATTPEDVLAEG